MASQVEKDEETKRRVSASMNMDAFTLPPVPPRNLIVPPSPISPPQSHKEAIVLPKDDDLPHDSDKKLSPIPPDKLVVPPSPSGNRDASLNNVAFPKARPKTTSTPPRSPLVNYPQQSIVPAKAEATQRPSLPLLPLTMNSLEHRRLGEQKRMSLPGYPSPHRPSLPPSSPHRPQQQQQPLQNPNTPAGEGQKQRLSLSEALAARDGPSIATPSSSPTSMHHHKLLGEKKTQRVSLPPSAKLGQASPTSMIAQQQPPSTPSRKSAFRLLHPLLGSSPTSLIAPHPPSTPSRKSPIPTPPATPGGGQRHRLGDKKAQRVSLPPSAKLGQSSPTSMIQQQPPSTPSRKSVVSTPPATPGSGHRHKLGDKKNQRVSLPPSVNLAQTSPSFKPPQPNHRLGDKKHRASLPASLLTSSDVPVSHHRKLGERKSHRQSLPNSSVAADAFMSSSSRSLRSNASAHDDLPRKGLRNNSLQQQYRSLPDISGPGAFFVPAALVGADDTTSDMQQQSSTFINTDCNDEMVDMEQGTSNNDLSEKTDTGNEEIEEEEYRLSAAFSVPPPPPSPRSSPPRRAPAAETTDQDEGPPKRRPCGGFRAPWWCNVVVPLILASGIAAVVIVIIKSTGVMTNGGDAPARPSSGQVIRIFQPGTAPNYTVEAWKDPSSPQSKAREWLRADPNIGSYSQDRRLQRFALASLYYATNGNRWRNATNWLNHSVHECLWFSARPSNNADVGTTSAFQLATNSSSVQIKAAKAITCNDKLEYEHLLLASDSLRGTLPPELSLLSSLVHIDLERNKVFGPVPTEIGALAKLTDLSLSDNELDASIPSEFGLLSNLERLYLRQNQFVGTLPEQLAELTLLNDLHLSSLMFLGFAMNSLNTTFPTELARLTNLQTLLATSSGIRGSIPTQVGEMTSLVALAVAANRLTNKLPTEIGNLSNLKWIYLYSNQLSGPLPSELGNLGHLSHLHTYVNPISSTIPSEIGQLSGLTELLVFESLLSGEIPSEIGNLQKLEWLNIGDTSITGTFPNTTCALESSRQLKVTADCNREDLICCG
ncbi:Leucine Rich Repeat [Seminavis robusta]|uniref:Leucine Rich Repeat n=1 Tax=Seminavis robusta TaxID=568900 RepID=A0A9N8EPH2_9STRA|nr:Leucine Rich Repeat [Seminavis robusta]|eukprot:Sro1290_g259800.1 Leucine Rich Repeat (1049) ;mRNA; r:16094-19503